MDFGTLLQMLDATLRLATPLPLACLAGLYSELAGIFDIGLEGKMLAAAFLSAAVAAVSGSVWLGLLAGIGASMLLSAVHGLASITFRGNQLISGVAINFLAAGLTVVIAQSWFAQGGRTPQLSGGARFNPIELPFAQALQDVPIIGPIYYELISGHTILVYVALLMVPLTWWILFRTRFGLRLRAVGENPAAVDTAGVSVVAAFCRGRHLRHPMRHCGCLLGHGPPSGLCERHECRARIYRPRRTDLCKMAALVCALCLPAVRLLAGHVIASRRDRKRAEL